MSSLMKKLKSSAAKAISCRRTRSSKSRMRSPESKRRAKINIAVLDYIGEHIKEGMSTEEIDKMVYERTTAMGGIPAPLHYQGFPKSVCTSINDQVCHGITVRERDLKRR